MLALSDPESAWLLCEIRETNSYQARFEEGAICRTAKSRLTNELIRSELHAIMDVNVLVSEANWRPERIYPEETA